MPKPLHVLIVEDSEDDVLLLVRELRRGGFDPVYEQVETPEAMMTSLLNNRWDIVISDYILPRFSGPGALKILKDSGLDLPFIIVSGNIGEDIAVESMKAGASDYIIKGNLRRLCPAVERELREAEEKREGTETRRRINASNELFKLFSQTVSRKEYLDSVLEMVRKWSGCRCAGLRILGEDEAIPYESYIGFDQKFWESESRISLRKDNCICTRVTAGRPESWEMPFMSTGGSFFCNNLLEFIGALNETRKKEYRSQCLNHGFMSLAVIPVRHRDRIIGAIHLADEMEEMVSLRNIEFIELTAPLVGEALYKFSIEEELRKKIETLKGNEEELLYSREQLRNLSIYLQSAREEERTNIAREIHDELGQMLTAMKMDLSWLKNKCRCQSSELLDKTSSLLTLVDSTLGTVKRISSELRPTVLDHLGLAAAIEWQADEVRERAALAFDINIPEDLRLDKVLSTTLFRIFQEALTNVIRHAKATRVDVRLEARDNDIILTISDNGRGITKTQLSSIQSFGLIGMQERAYFLGGSVEISGARNKGTSVKVIMPLDRSDK